MAGDRSTDASIKQNSTHLDFVDEDIVERVDGLAGLFDVFADGVGDQLVDGFLQVGRTNLLGDDLHHLTADVLSGVEEGEKKEKGNENG